MSRRRLATRLFALALANGCGAAAAADASRPPAALGESDPARAWREAVAEPDTPRHRAITRAATLRALAPAVAEPDPRSALLLADTLRGVERDILIGAAWEAWGRKDARAALAGLEELPELSARQGCIANGWPVYRVVEGWTQADPRAAFAWMAADSEDADLAHLPLRAIAESDVAEALGLAGQLRGTPRQLAFATVLQVWAESDPHGAAGWFEDADPKDAAWVFAPVLRAWAGSDPRGAAAWLEDKIPEDATQVFSSVARVWASASPEQALDWVHTLPTHLQLDVTRAAIVGAARTSPAAASDLLGRIQDPQRRAQATRTLVSQWVVSAPGDARRWIAHAVEGEARRDLYVSLFDSWADRDRERAADELRWIANPRHRDAAAFAVLGVAARDIRVSARMAQREGESPDALGRDIDFAEELHGRIHDAETRQRAAKLLYDTLGDIAPERAERYRALAGATDESG